MPRILVGMSGGVDSSLVAALVRERGDEVVGVTMKLWPCAELDGGFTREDACCSPTETIDARAVAVGIGVRHYVVDFEEGFRRGVVDGFIEAYKRGETPNPCVRCNETVKFGHLWTYAASVGAERVATGHYARVTQALDRWILRRSVDGDKDQTYFLFSLTQEQLAHADFPLGGMTKDAVRSEARARSIITADKRESQDICFIGDDGIAGFLRREAPEAFHPGPIRHLDGRVLGEHQGLAGFTLGQRKGLAIAWTEPLYVVGVDTVANELILGPLDVLITDRLRLRDVTWHPGTLPATGADILVRLRHRARPVAARLVPTAAGAELHFPQPQQRSAPGQAAVLYDLSDDLCLGGGWVTGSTLPPVVSGSAVAAVM